MTAPAAARTGADDWNRNERDIIEACVRAASVSPDLRAAALAELARLRAAHQTQQDALRDVLASLDWYRRCLEDVQDGRVVRGLAEAKAGYDSALADLAAVSGTANTETEER